MNEPTRVLVWSPGYLSEDGSAAWELVTVAEFESGNYPDVVESVPDLPRNAWTDELEAWVGRQLGYPVSLSPDTYQIKTRHFGHRHTEPIYWVRRREQ